jgi:hypothetical protein
LTGRRERRSRKLLDDLKERTGYSHLKKKALDHTMWRARFGRCFGPIYIYIYIYIYACVCVCVCARARLYRREEANIFQATASDVVRKEAHTDLCLILKDYRDIAV